MEKVHSSKAGDDKRMLHPRENFRNNLLVFNPNGIAILLKLYCQEKLSEQRDIYFKIEKICLDNQCTALCLNLLDSNLPQVVLFT
jgi:hypothetical protein